MTRAVDGPSALRTPDASGAKDGEESGRHNQRRRTRKDLLAAAATLMRSGAKPSLDAVAEAAMVSRATAYRYFPSIDALLVEASIDVATPEADALFSDDRTADPIARLERADAALHDTIVANEPSLRLMLANALERSARGVTDGDIPARQNRRTPLIDAALAPARQQFKPAALAQLRNALALVIGTEARVVCKDVLQLGDAESNKLRRWMIRALVDAARK